MPAHVWDFLKAKGFFAMIIPKHYGGLEFSAFAHSCVLVKIASRSVTASSTVAVPNSLGPAELLNHYGTQEQKDYYLPRLARGEEVPCFALTGPRAGIGRTVGQWTLALGLMVVSALIYQPSALFYAVPLAGALIAQRRSCSKLNPHSLAARRYSSLSVVCEIAGSSVLIVVRTPASSNDFSG